MPNGKGNAILVNNGTPLLKRSFKNLKKVIGKPQHLQKSTNYDIISVIKLIL